MATKQVGFRFGLVGEEVATRGRRVWFVPTDPAGDVALQGDKVIR